jgi:hypothetical protein
MITVNIKESDGQLNRSIKKALADHINRKIRSKNRSLVGRIKRSVQNWVLSQPEIRSLLSEGVPNSLNSQFGLAKGSSQGIVNSIVNAVVDSTEIEIKKVNQKLDGEIIFKFQPSSFANLLSLSSGVVVTERGSNLKWLEWLLLEGDRIIIVGYKYQPSEDGRAGGGTMLSGSGFRVPPNYSGTREDNFITRAFSGRSTELTQLISGLFK